MVTFGTGQYPNNDVLKRLCKDDFVEAARNFKLQYHITKSESLISNPINVGFMFEYQWSSQVWMKVSRYFCENLDVCQRPWVRGWMYANPYESDCTRMRFVLWRLDPF